MTRLLLSLLATAFLVRADFDPARWQFRRSIIIAMPAAVASFPVGRAVYQASLAELADVRVIRDQAETPYLLRELQDRDEFSISPATTEEASTRTTLITGDIGFDGLPHDRVQMVVDPGQFYRWVELESSSDSKKWKRIGNGFISRTEDLGVYTVSFREQWDRYIRVRIFNQDNPPLIVRQLILSAERRVVEFPAEARGQYWLYYGSRGARKPSYDFAQTRPLHTAEINVLLGVEENNPAYREPEKPWSDRRPGILFGVLAGAIVIMGFIAARFLLRIQS